MRRGEFLRMAGAAAISAAVTHWATKRTRFSAGHYVQFGTSVTAGTGTKYGGAAPALVGDRLDMPAANVAVPGSCAGVHKIPELSRYSLCYLTDAVVSGDWSKQSARTGNVIADAAIARLMTTDFARVTHAGLEYGTNDFHYDRPLGADSDVSDETFRGALNYSIARLRSAYPALKLFLITPAWMPTEAGLDGDRNANGCGDFLRDYVDAMAHVAGAHGIPCLDMWRRLGVNAKNVSAFAADGTHPTDAAVFRRAEIIAAFINSEF
jgi:lysophospholipase L1-like esterase